jgi:hypothetical protein
MNRELLREYIIDIINSRGAVRHIDIVDDCIAMNSGTASIGEALSELSQDSKIKRIEYILPNSTVRRAIYFPYGTKIE